MSCQLEKQHCVFYPSRFNKRVDKQFDLVHSDVWGPCRVTSKLSFRYFVSFVDDNSRVTWLYLLKSRSEIYSTFKTFYSETKNQINSDIKVLRSNNAKEYSDSNFRQFLEQNEILHQSFCVYTPQQNGDSIT